MAIESPQEIAVDLDYERTLRKQRANLNPIIVIPGILGSKLVDEDYSHSI